MNKQEAELFFINRGEESYVDYYQELLFDFKQFFIQKPPIQKVFKAKLTKLSKLNEAFGVLSNEINEESFEFELPLFTAEVKDSFRLYYSKRNQLNERVTQSNSGTQIIEIVESLLNLSNAYSEKWPLIEDENPTLKVGVEPNPMELLKAIESFEKSGFSTFEDIHKLPGDHLLVLESKRLTLLRKMNTHVG